MRKKTVLELCQAVAKRKALPYPSALVGSTDVSELQWLQLLIEVCEDIRAAEAFIQQKGTHSWTTVSGTRTYQLPQDFYKQIPNTAWHTGDLLPLQGPVNDPEMASALYGVDTSIDYRYRLFGPDDNPNSAGGQIELEPTPSAADSLVFEYLSSNLFKPPNWAPSTAYVIGNYVNCNGRNYVCDTNGTSGATGPTGTTNNQSDGTTQWDYYGTPYEAPITDNDLCIFDDDLVKLGLRAYWRDEKGEDWQSAMDEFESRIKSAQARMQGSIRGSFNRRGQRGPRYRLPYGSWV